MDIHINSKDGIITDIKVFSDSLYPQLVDEIKNNLQGVTYDKKGITEGLQRAYQSLQHNEDTNEISKYILELLEWITKEI
jgi:hypothetical protein